MGMMNINHHQTSIFGWGSGVGEMPVMLAQEVA